MSLLDILLKPLLSGVVTKRYPPHTDVPDRGRRGTPQLLPERCDASADCAAACPTSAISIQGRADVKTVWTLDYGLCVFCGRCIEVCPTQAIASSDEFELAARRREDVVATFVVGKHP
jgi:hydrogenase-4 component H